MGWFGVLVVHASAKRTAKKLIEAAVASAYGQGAPPQELKLAWLSKQWGALPTAGGLYDQEYQVIYRMTALSNVHEVIQRMRNAKGAQIHNLSAADRGILDWLRREGFL